MPRTPKVIRTSHMCAPSFAYNAYNNIKPPCKDCTERYIGCHNECAKYKDYRVNLDTARKEMKDRGKKSMDYCLARKSILWDRIKW